MQDTLVRSIDTTQGLLSARFENALASQPTPDRPRDRYPATDTFLASTSRHLAAANATLVPAARRHLADGTERAHEFSQHSRRLEFAMAQTKAKLYGEAHAIYRPWSEIWADLREQLDDWLALEADLVRELAEHTETAYATALAEKLYHAELRSPTRPHPYVPHLGVTGKVARRIARRVDMFWDTTEGRMIPEPVHPHDRKHDGRIAQYFLADPHLEKIEEEPED